MKKTSYSIAFGGMVSALCLALEFSIGILPIFLYIFPQICAILIYILWDECGGKTSLCVYVGVSLLSLLICPDKEGALLFVSFFGYYPIIRTYIQRIKSKAAGWVVKLMIYNVSLVLRNIVLINVFGITEAQDGLKWLWITTTALENLVFIFFDKLLELFLKLYIAKYKGKLFKRKH